MKIKIFALLICIAWLLHADDCCNNYCDSRSTRCGECVGLTLFADGLYWQAREDGLDYVIQNNDGSALIDDACVRRVNFDWHGGFRFGAGYCSPCCNYFFNAFWTRFHTKGDDCLKVTFPTTLFPVWSNPSSMLTTEENARACVNLDLDMFDARLTALFTPHCCIDVMPYIGLVYAKINQNFNINMSGGLSTQPFRGDVLDDAICMRNNFRGVGPKVGVNSIWGLGCGLGFFARADAALAYGKFDICQKETVTFSENSEERTFLNIKCNEFHMVRPIVDLILGVRWDTPINRDAFCCQSRYHLYLEAGWELIYFFGQNMLMRFTDDINAGANVTVQGDLATQGLTVRASFAF